MQPTPPRRHSTWLHVALREILTVITVAKYSTPLYDIAVHYEADENGYRVTSMETEEIGSGPVQNKEGKAFVQSLQHGLESTYAIMGKQGRKEWAEMFHL